MRFYETNWFLWLTLILCAPIGIFVLWKFHSEETTKLKMILSVIFLALFIVMIIVGHNLMKDDKNKDKEQKPEKEIEEEAEVEPKEDIGSLEFTFSPNVISMRVDERQNILVSNVEETDEVVWSTEDPAIAYVESGVGNSCVLVGGAEGKTTLTAHSPTGSGKIQVEVKATAKAKETTIETIAEHELDESAMSMGSNFKYDLDISEDISDITLNFWFEGFSGEYMDANGGDTHNIKGLKKKALEYNDMMKSAIENAGMKPNDITITINFLNGTEGEPYNNDVVDSDVTNDIVFSIVNGEEVSVDNN
jgi:hypothetical protein